MYDVKRLKLRFKLRKFLKKKPADAAFNMCQFLLKLYEILGTITNHSG